MRRRWRTAACSSCSTTSSRSSTLPRSSAALLAVPRPSSVLATSRILLRVGGEHSRRRSAPLTSAAAADLFVERARAVKPDFELTEDNAARSPRSATALDNVPLALELAAARAARAHAGRARRTARPRAVPARRRRRATSPSASARSGPPSTGAPSCCIGASATCCCGSGSSAPGSASMRSSGWPRTSGAGDGDVVDALAALVDGSLVREQDRGDARLVHDARHGSRVRARAARTTAATSARWQERHARFYVALRRGLRAVGRNGTGRADDPARR